MHPTNSPCYHTDSFLDEKRLLGKRATSGLSSCLTLSRVHVQVAARKTNLAPVRNPTRVLPERFILSDIVERQVADGIGYSLLEPTVTLEIHGINVLVLLGI